MKTIYKKLLLTLFLLPFSVLAQSTITGVVTEKASGQSIPGVNVNVKGTTVGTSTDFDGKYSLSKLNSGDVLEFSYLGFKTQSVTVGSQKVINVSMEEEASSLEEIVLIGYGNVKKKDATGSVATVTTKEFNKGANVTAENLLNGRVAGLTVNTSGAPGSGSQIRIRGGGSLFASNDPLIVIDGLPVSNSTNTGSTSILASINPNDIESFSVLKDASATAIYGSRASNGVIIITTKKGGKKLSVDYNFQYGSGKLIDKVDVFSADDYRTLIADKFPDDLGQLGTANTDWQDEIYRRTDFVDNNLSIKGQLFNAIPVRLSLGNTYQEGLRLTNNFNRNNVSVNLNPSFFEDHLRIKVNATYAVEKNRFADGVEGAALNFDPTQPVYDASSPFGGFFEYYNADGTIKKGPKNPVAQLLQTRDFGKNNRFFGNFEVDYKFHFLPELRGVVNVGFDESNGERTRNVPRTAASAPENGSIPYGTNEYSERTMRNKLFDSYLVYNKMFGNLNFEATAGYSYQIFQGESFYTRNTLQPNYGAIGAETDIDTDNVIIGFFGRANLSFYDKYLFTFTFRRDGSSRFSPDNRWLNTPGVAFAWKMKEDFFANNNTLSDLKLRLGYGITGQQSLPNDANDYYLYQVILGNNTNQIIFGDTPNPIAIFKPNNPDLKWEKTTTYNAGIDYGFLDNRISGSVDFFYKKTEDLIVRAAIADGANFSNRIYQNVGSFDTKGVEFTLNADVVKKDNFSWNVNFNASKFERRIEDLAFDSDILLGDAGVGIGSTAQIFREGYTPYSFYVYKQLYDTNGRAIEGAFGDLNGDGIINGDDRYIYKNPDPDATFGFASTMNFYNFDFSFNLRASVGNRVYNIVDAARANYDNLKQNGILNNIPTAVTDYNFNTVSNIFLSDVFIENASFLRMDNITLGYTFQNWLEGKASVRLFTGVQNAFVLTKYSGLDPEITNDGRDNTIYPRQRSFLFGANIKF